MKARIAVAVLAVLVVGAVTAIILQSGPRGEVTQIRTVTITETTTVEATTVKTVVDVRTVATTVTRAGETLAITTTVREAERVTYTVARTVTTTVTAEGAKVLAVCFSPEGGCLDILLELLENAKTSIYAMIYSFTLDDLSSALIEAKARGVDVKVLMETDNAFSRGSEYTKLASAGVDIRLDANRYLMHHKVLVIDGRIVVTGSMNWSFSGAYRNNENIIVLEDPEVAAIYLSEFNKLWKQAG